MKSLEEYVVARSAAELDRRIPGWADHIDIRSLTMSDPCSCVLGQIGQAHVNLDRVELVIDQCRLDMEGEYTQVLHALKWEDGATHGVDAGDITRSQATKLGVPDNIVNSDVFDDEVWSASGEALAYLEYEMLEEAWKQAIRARKTHK